MANEVLDALPVDRFRIRSGRLKALGVSWRQDRLDWSEAPATPPLEHEVREIEAQIGSSIRRKEYTSEINLRLDPWLRSPGWRA